jgi:drug/metabolite transporter (DMT)-like permease
MEGMSRSSLSRALPWIALITVWILWGSTYLGIRVAVQTIPPFLMAGTRYMIAGAVLAIGMLIWDRTLLSQMKWPQWRSLLTTAALLLLGGNGILCWAEQVLPSGIAALIVATVPIAMVVVNALLTRVAIPLAAIVGLVLGSLGIIALVGIHAGSIPLVPAVMTLIASISWATGSVLGRLNAADRRNPLLPALEMFAGGVMLCIAGASLGEIPQVHVAAITTASWLGWLWLIVGGAIVGYTAYVYAVRKLPTNIVATYAYVNPIVAVALGSLVLGEPITLNVIVGGAIIVLGVLAILRAPKETSEQRQPKAA